MFTAAIITKDTSHIETWRACLQQTGLVNDVQEWALGAERLPRNGAVTPDVALVDLARDTEHSLQFCQELKQSYPGLRIIACTHLQEPTRDLLMQAMRNGVQEIISKPIDPVGLTEILKRFAQENRTVGAFEKNLLVVMGSKGGVGTTTVAVNLGVQMVRAGGKRVVLLDFSRPIGHAGLLLDLQTRFSLRDAIENLDRLDDHFFSGLLTQHKSGLEVLAGMSHPEEWHRTTGNGLTRVVNVAQSAFDFVVLDYGTVYAAEWSSILPLARMVLFVTEANVPSLWALQRHLKATAPLGLGPDKVRIIVNRWHRGDDDVLRNVEKDFGHPIFARLPNDYRLVSDAINQGVPLAKNQSNALVATFQRIASQVAGVSAQPSSKRKGRGLFSL